jgi:hypothetical protein
VKRFMPAEAAGCRPETRGQVCLCRRGVCTGLNSGRLRPVVVLPRDERFVEMQTATREESSQPLSYDDLLREFKVSLSRVLSGSVLPPGTSIPDGRLTLALLDIAYAARNGEPTNYLVSRACFEFSKVAAALEPKPTRHLKVVR